MSKKLILMRGLPGSGKSTIANSLDGLVLSTDDFFIKKGVYKFNVRQAGIAHGWNQKRAKDAMSRGESLVIIDNTNITASEMKPYVKMALNYGYKVEILEATSPHKLDVDKLAEYNSHGVSKDSIQKMKDRYQHNVTIEDLVK
ncbi:ATP-binding protein [archaeon]|nr:ATP-binding protein [archaeon]